MEDLLSHAYQRSLQYERKLSCLGDNKIRRKMPVNRQQTQQQSMPNSRQSLSMMSLSSSFYRFIIYIYTWTVFPPNIAPPLFGAEKYIFAHQNSTLFSLIQHSLINKTLNMSLNNIKCCFVMVLTLIS